MTIWDGPSSLDAEFTACPRCGTYILDGEPNESCTKCLIDVMAGGTP